MMIDNALQQLFKKFTMHKFASALTFIAMIILSAFSVWSFYTIRKTEHTEYVFFANKTEYSNFFTLFEIPIKLAVAAFAVFATWLTLRRITQTERQLKMMDDNNKFTNYYKHMEEFIRYFEKMALIHKLNTKNLINTDTRIFLRPLYFYYYYTSYKDFAPIRNDKIQKHIFKFRKIIMDSILNKKGTIFSQLHMNQFPSTPLILDPVINPIVDVDVNASITTIQTHLFNNNFTKQQIDDQIANYRTISYLYWTDSFYTDILVFDGEMCEISENFMDNYDHYLGQLGL